MSATVAATPITVAASPRQGDEGRRYRARQDSSAATHVACSELGTLRGLRSKLAKVLGSNRSKEQAISPQIEFGASRIDKLVLCAELDQETLYCQHSVAQGFERISARHNVARESSASLH